MTKIHSLSSPAVITGSHKASVSSAITRVELLIDSFRKKQPFTHFLSVPLNDPKIQEGFLKFKEEVLEQCSKVKHKCINCTITFSYERGTCCNYVITSGSWSRGEHLSKLGKAPPHRRHAGFVERDGGEKSL